MCGIVGALCTHRADLRAEIETLNIQQAHRGPDNSAVADEGICWLGNTRLSIQDPSDAGNQPFVDPEGRYVTVFNGEVYNFSTLIADHDLKVRTGCDTETISLLWSLHGPACLPLLRGMYAIAVFDRVEQRLYLARDPFGIKPLFWRRQPDRIVFASEVKPLWRLDRSLPLSTEALESFLHFGAVAAGSSPFTGIEAVKPGTCVSFGPCLDERFEGHVEQLANPVTDGAADHLAPMGPLAAALFDSVQHHLVSDVPTALLLSAGVDSSAIAFAASRLGEPLLCLTVTGALGQDETAQARATVAELGHTHETVPTVLDGSSLSRFFEAMQQPTVDGLNTFLVCRAVAASGFKVALSGLGGDEALGGYSTARQAQLAPLLALTDRLPPGARSAMVRFLRERVPRLGSTKALRLLGPQGPRTATGLIELQRELFPPSTIRNLGIPAHSDPPAHPGIQHGILDKITAAEVRTYLQPMLLPDADAFSSASSVELRVPFVDRNFFAAASTRRHLRGKRELVRQLGDRYMALLASRPKTGFSVPMQIWMADGVLADQVREAQASDAPVWSHLDRGLGLDLLRRPSSRWSDRWALAALDGWLRSL